MKARHFKGGGINGYQFIGLGLVVSFLKNSSWSNGDVHGWRLSINLRKNTAL